MIINWYTIQAILQLVIESFCGVVLERLMSIPNISTFKSLEEISVTLDKNCTACQKQMITCSIKGIEIKSQLSYNREN